jgi:hypothetical protein
VSLGEQDAASLFLITFLLCSYESRLYGIIATLKRLDGQMATFILAITISRVNGNAFGAAFWFLMVWVGFSSTFFLFNDTTFCGLHTGVEQEVHRHSSAGKAFAKHGIPTTICIGMGSLRMD